MNPTSNLPKVSIITITKDRRDFIPLAKYCFLAQAYPEDGEVRARLRGGDDFWGASRDWLPAGRIHRGWVCRPGVGIGVDGGGDGFVDVLREGRGADFAARPPWLGVRGSVARSQPGRQPVARIPQSAQCVARLTR